MRHDLNETILQLCVLDDPARRAAYLAVRTAGRPLTRGQKPTAAGASPRPPSNLTAVLGGDLAERLERRIGGVCFQSLGQDLGGEVVPPRRDRHLELETE